MRWSCAAIGFAGWRINWNDKAANIAELAANSPGPAVGRLHRRQPVRASARVSSALPEVLVPEWPADPTLYVATLGSRSTASTSRSHRRGFRPDGDVRSRQRARQPSDVEVELARRLDAVSCDVVVTVEPLDERNLPRATQLLNKTNQMNLRTRRLTSRRVDGDWPREGERATWCISVVDRLGDAGLTGFLLSIEADGATARIVDFVLSCRVMGRKARGHDGPPRVPGWPGRPRRRPRSSPSTCRRPRTRRADASSTAGCSSRMRTATITSIWQIQCRSPTASRSGFPRRLLWVRDERPAPPSKPLRRTRHIPRAALDASRRADDQENAGQFRVGDDVVIASRPAMTHLAVGPGALLDVGNGVRIGHGAAISTLGCVELGEHRDARVVRHRHGLRLPRRWRSSRRRASGAGLGRVAGPSSGIGW